ncbi:MAG: GxxExxY protein [Ardenticatenales bacterium]|nr:GxxExxY protein [Ardenticatenales bacterium]
MGLRHAEITGRILKAYYEVWNHTARLYPEVIYERCMQGELAPHLPCKRQDAYEIFYKNIKVGGQRLDMFLADEIVVELKVVPELTKLHKAQTISYIKVVGKRDGLLINFGGTQPTFHRLFYNEPEQPPAEGTIRKKVQEMAGPYAPDLVYEINAALFEVFRHLGPGFIQRIYANACYQEFLLRGLAPQSHRQFEVIYKGKPAGPISLKHIQIADILLFPIARTDPNALPIKIMKDYLAYMNYPLAIIANFQDTKLSPIIIRP